MKNSFLFLLVSLFFIQYLSAQDGSEKKIKGVVSSETAPLEGVSIINSKNKINAISDKNGNFSIDAKQGDLLIFSATGYQPLSKYVSIHDISLQTITLQMSASGIELKEVLINEYPEITAEKLGIIKPGQIKYTPAERKLNAGSSGVVGFINLLTGELKNLKANVNVEKKEILLQKLEYLFEDEFYKKDLKIPSELIKGFKYYCVEDSEFAKAVNSKNKIMCKFLIIELASTYNKIRLSDENAK